MNEKKVELQQGFDVIGLSMRTSNKAALSEGTIQKLWGRFFAEQIIDKIPNKVDSALVAIYYDYESDKDGEYTLLVGARVSTLGEIPVGMIGIHVPKEKRATFVSEPGQLSCIVFDLWKVIWKLEDQELLKRSYSFDYELYDERSRFDEAIVEIHISVK